MDHLFFKELSALLRETEKLMACSAPDAEAWEGYGRLREKAFHRLQQFGSLPAEKQSERAKLAELIKIVIERDRLLMQKLEECLACCREGLSTVPKARRALNGYLPLRSSSFVQRNV
jgi:hypothetical protein